MHAFVILGHKAPLTPEFTLNDLPGSAGRLDVLCRCIHAALFLSHDLRRDVEVFLVIQDTLCVRVSGKSVKRLNPDERSTAALIKKALARIQTEHANSSVDSTPGISIARMTLAALLDDLKARGFEPVLLHEGPSSLRQAPLPDQPAFVLSDHMDFQARDLAVLGQAQRLSVGPNVYPASHCVVVVNNELDLRKAR